MIPSRRPADDGTLTGLLKFVVRKVGEGLDVQIPAVVVEYDRNANIATVQPLIDVQETTGEVSPRAPLANIPVLALGGGGFLISFPLQPGDKGWIEASDRDISLFLQSLEESAPNTFRVHTFEDGRFIPDVFNNYVISELDAANLVIQNLEGTVKFAMGPTGIAVTAPIFTWNNHMVRTS